MPSLNRQAFWYSFRRTFVSAIVTFFPVAIIHLWVPFTTGDQRRTIREIWTGIYEDGTCLYLAFSIGAAAFVAYLFKGKNQHLERKTGKLAMAGAIFILVSAAYGPALFELINKEGRDPTNARELTLYTLIVSIIYALAMYWALKYYSSEADDNLEGRAGPIIRGGGGQGRMVTPEAVGGGRPGGRGGRQQPATQRPREGGRGQRRGANPRR